LRNLSESQLVTLKGSATKPLFLIELDFDSPEHLSTNGDITINGNTYIGGDVGISSVADWTSATIKLSPSPTRVQIVVTGGWQGNPCKIYLVPVQNNQQIMQAGYVQSGYAQDGLTVEDPILLLDGVLTSANIQSKGVDVAVSHKALVGKWTPRLRITSNIANHLPSNGSVVVWEGDNYILESR